MAAFQVGQRVRIVDCFTDGARHLIGLETVIDDMGMISSPGGSVFGYGVAAGRTSMEHWGFTADQLEPIQYDGNALVAWESCVWQPSREVETA